MQLKVVEIVSEMHQISFDLQADDELALFNEQLKDKKRNLIMLIVVFFSMTGMILLDIVSRHRSAANYIEKEGKKGKNSNIFTLI